MTTYKKVIESCIAKIVRAGKAPGILIGDKQLASRYIELGAMFVGVGTDTGLLLNASAALACSFKPELKTPVSPTAKRSVY